jgi:formamidopyrimidine-DNA glycosylase
MPELPEVESIKKSLTNQILNSTILSVEIIRPKIVSSSSNIRTADVLKTNQFITQLLERKIVSIQRKVKNLVITLDNNSIIIVHLKMTGQLLFSSVIDSHHINKHTAVIFKLDNGTLVYNDIRQFGYVLYFDGINDAIANGHLISKAIDPYYDKINAKEVFEKFKLIKKPLKSVFFDQKVICGLGNIYADEVCFDAKVNPIRLTNSLTNTEVNKICDSITKIIHKSIEVGGSSISDYVLSDGSRGGYVEFHKVYGRKGLDCIECGTTLTRIIHVGRSTVFCNDCQS